MHCPQKLGFFIDGYRIFVPVMLDCLAVCFECLYAFSVHFWTDAVFAGDAATDGPMQLLSLRSFAVRCLHEPTTTSFRFDANLIVCFGFLFCFLVLFRIRIWRRMRRGKRKTSGLIFCDFFSCFFCSAKKKVLFCLAGLVSNCVKWKPKLKLFCNVLGAST